MPVYNLNKLNLWVCEHSTLGMSITLRNEKKPMCQLQEQKQELRSAQESKGEAKSTAAKEVVIYAQGKDVDSLFVGTTNSNEHAKFLADHKSLEGQKGANIKTYTIIGNNDLPVKNNSALQKTIQLLQQQVTKLQVQVLSFGSRILTSYGTIDLSKDSSLKGPGKKFEGNSMEKSPLVVREKLAEHFNTV